MEAQFEISSEIYDTVKIQEAISDFSDVCSVTYDAWVLSLSWDNQEELDGVFKEFMNYVLSL